MMQDGPKYTTLGAAEVRQHWSQLINQLFQDGRRILVQKHGLPVAAVISMVDLKRLEALDAAERAQAAPQMSDHAGQRSPLRARRHPQPAYAGFVRVARPFMGRAPLSERRASMDPITIIVTALAAGAAAGLQPTAEQAIKDAYAGVKELIQRRYASVDLTPLENKPASESKRASVAEDLTDAGAANDLELLDRAAVLRDAVATHDESAAKAIGLDLEGVKAEYLRARKIMAEGTGVKLRNSEFTGGIAFDEVQAGNVGGSQNPPQRQ